MRDEVPLGVSSLFTPLLKNWRNVFQRPLCAKPVSNLTVFWNLSIRNHAVRYLVDLCFRNYGTPPSCKDAS